jgi:hypothetical protein
MKLLREVEYMAATGVTRIPTTAFRSARGPHKAQLRS